MFSAFQAGTCVVASMQQFSCKCMAIQSAGTPIGKGLYFPIDLKSAIVFEHGPF